MKILISAAEASSDTHGAELLKALKQEYHRTEKTEGMGGPGSPNEPDKPGKPGKPGKIDAFGIGGPKLQAAGLRAVVDARELLVMGFVEVVSHLPKILRALNRITLEAKEQSPDVAVVIDYPEFHFRLARKLKKLGIPVVYYIPPKVWVWRKGRVKVLKELFQKILCILPFEESFYKEFNISAKYVGNPLVDELPLHLTQAEARKGLQLEEADRVLLLMIGSRESEWKHHLELFLDAASLTSLKLRNLGQLGTDESLKILMPFPMTAPMERLKEKVARWKDPRNQQMNICLSQGNAPECMVAADAGLVKSGTSTLEAGLLQCPHVIAFKPGLTTTWIYKNLIRYKGPVGLVNLVAGWSEGQPYLVPELLCENATVELMAAELLSLISPTEKHQKMIQGFEQLRTQVQGGPQGDAQIGNQLETHPEFQPETQKGTMSPSLNAAREILGLVESLRHSNTNTNTNTNANAKS